ncbi:GNAT family N-acetyltransferase, partial [Legionella pneumophila]
MVLINISKSHVMSDFKFQPLGINDLNKLHQWFQEPIINHWYA